MLFCHFFRSGNYTHFMSGLHVVHQNQNPSTDFFIRPWLAREGREAQFHTFTGTLPDAAELAGAMVVFVRYIPPAWKALLNRSRPGRLVFFMDDDLFDHRAFRGMPLRYQRKLFRFAWQHQRWLKKQGAELWVSSPWLAEKYSAWLPQVTEPGNPHPLPALLSADNSGPAMKTLFYHGSASHRGELEWLVPVVEALLHARQDVGFEVIGDRKVRDRFAHVAGVQVVHPMSWLDYQVFIRRPGRTVGLAPLLDTPFNAARAPTKFYDITAAGATGIYADHPVYRSMVRHSVNGLLLPTSSPEPWAEAILALLDAPEQRAALVKQALSEAAGHANQHAGSPNVHA